MTTTATNRGVGILTFPGSNGDHDAYHAFRDGVGVPTRLVDHRETDLRGFGAIVLPGGFSYGDYLRSGAIARFAPVMESVREFAERGGPVLGICNGFQVLTEAHLLPGALVRNRTLRFHCHWTHVRFEQTATAWTEGLRPGDVLRLPIAHGDGCYYADRETLDRLEANGRIVARYVGAEGALSEEANANGSARSIAAIANDQGTVVGLMPHPERAADDLLGSSDGLRMLRSVLSVVGSPA